MDPTTDDDFRIENVTTNERAFRALSGMGALIPVLAGAVASPLVIFILATTGVYLVLTMTLGIDPVYSLARRLARALTEPRPEDEDAIWT